MPGQIGFEEDETKRLIEEDEEKLNYQGLRQARPGEDAFDWALAKLTQKAGTMMWVACVAHVAG